MEWSALKPKIEAALTTNHHVVLEASLWSKNKENQWGTGGWYQEDAKDHGCEISLAHFIEVYFSDTEHTPEREWLALEKAYTRLAKYKQVDVIVRGKNSQPSQDVNVYHRDIPYVECDRTHEYMDKSRFKALLTLGTLNQISLTATKHSQDIGHAGTSGSGWYQETLADEGALLFDGMTLKRFFTQRPVDWCLDEPFNAEWDRMLACVQNLSKYKFVTLSACIEERYEHASGSTTTHFFYAEVMNRDIPYVKPKPATPTDIDHADSELKRALLATESLAKTLDGPSLARHVLIAELRDVTVAVRNASEHVHNAKKRKTATE